MTYRVYFTDDEGYYRYRDFNDAEKALEFKDQKPGSYIVSTSTSTPTRSVRNWSKED